MDRISRVTPTTNTPEPAASNVKIDGVVSAQVNSPELANAVKLDTGQLKSTNLSGPTATNAKISTLSAPEQLLQAGRSKFAARTPGSTNAEHASTVAKEIKITPAKIGIKERAEHQSEPSTITSKNLDALVDRIGEDNFRKSYRPGSTARDKIQGVLATYRGSRPDPTSVYTSNYIDRHLELFKDGGVCFMTSKSFSQYCKATIGYKGATHDTPVWGALEGNKGFYSGASLAGQFCMPPIDAKRILESTHGDPVKIAEALGIPSQYWVGQEICMITFKNTKDILMPSGNEEGANAEWLPGGFTPNGIHEAILPRVKIAEAFKNNAIALDIVSSPIS